MEKIEAFDSLLDYSENENDWCDDVIMQENQYSADENNQFDRSRKKGNETNLSIRSREHSFEGNRMSQEWNKSGLITHYRNKKWKRTAISNDRNLLNIMQQIIFEFIKFNTARTNYEEATRFVVGWIPKSIKETVIWINDIVKRIIIIDATVTIDATGLIMIKGLMLRRPETSLINHTKITADKGKILVKMTDYMEDKQRREY